MNTLNFKMLEHVAVNLRRVMKDKRQKVELEERLRMRFSHEFNVDPERLSVDLVYNRMADSFDIVIKREENEP